jgi:hypothetical protein
MVLLRRSVLLIALGFVPAAVFGQQPAPPPARTPDTGTRSVHGKVTNPAGVAVDGAVVLLKDTKTLQVRSFITTKGGQYHFYGLSRNTNYQLRADYQGTGSDTKTLSVFDSKKDSEINLKLKNAS